MNTTQRYLEVTFRNGRPFAAYLYLSRERRGRVVRTSDEGRGIHVDFDDAGTAVGLEVTAPSMVVVEELSAVLAKVGAAPLASGEWAPAHAA